MDNWVMATISYRFVAALWLWLYQGIFQIFRDFRKGFAMMMMMIMLLVWWCCRCA